MQHDVQLVHVIFKTHLDVGFTDYASTVIDQYMTRFIPDAIALARNLEDNYPDEPFCWTVGSWLIYEYLERASPEQRTLAEAAIRDALVAWHAVPFTTHTEAMDADLFRYGLSLSQALDKRFDRQTIAGKMTDVPGHTRAMIPLLAEAGIRFFHVGVNAAATVPDVPPLFKWVDEASNTHIFVMYQHVYGDVMRLPGTNEAVALVFTGDNLGPPTIASVHQTYAELRQRFPHAKFIGSTLDAVARSLIAANADLPIITDEIGDTWIQGIGTDPTKISQYRELLRLRQHWVDEKRIDEATLNRFQHALIMIPEHTWGMDLKTHLAEYEHYDTQALVEARNLPNFRKFEKSWQEQRDYIARALAVLDGSSLKEEAEQSLRDIQPQKPVLADFQVTQIQQFESQHWLASIDSTTGAINHLVHRATKRILADDSHPISCLLYETFSTADYERYWEQYIRDRDVEETRIWALPDNTKPNLQVEDHVNWYPNVGNIYFKDDTILVEGSFPAASREIGAPQLFYLEYTLTENLQVSLRWFDKPACRLPEAFWLSFQPLLPTEGTWSIHKLGSKINPTNVVSKGARTLHGIHDGISFSAPDVQLVIRSLDAPLVAPYKPALLNFANKLPDSGSAMHFNLYNNVWGTNFPMWFDDNALFRFFISIG